VENFAVLSLCGDKMGEIGKNKGATLMAASILQSVQHEP
jgi:hypothetical protein